MKATSDIALISSQDRCQLKARRILIIDDDTALCSLIADFLACQGFAVDSAQDGRTGVIRVLTVDYDLIILDVMLPVQDGFEVLREVRKQSSVPIIMLTARAEQQDRIAGLERGADDYLTKPFGPQELLARIRAVLRRIEQPLDRGILRVGDLALDAHARTVSRGERQLSITSHEFDILSILMRLAGRVVSRDEIAAILYKRESTPFERGIDVHVSHLRKKIEADGKVKIRTVRGTGYVFVVPGDEP